MPPLRHRTRHLRAGIVDRVTTGLTAAGWMSAPVNFSGQPLRVIDYQPDEAGEVVLDNTVAVSIGEVPTDLDEELGAAGGGLRSAYYPIFLDVYMVEQGLTDAVCDDLRALFDQAIFPLVDQISGLDSGERIEIEDCIGPDRPDAAASLEGLKRHWRVMRIGARLYYQS